MPIPHRTDRRSLLALRLLLPELEFLERLSPPGMGGRASFAAPCSMRAVRTEREHCSVARVPRTARWYERVSPSSRRTRGRVRCLRRRRSSRRSGRTGARGGCRGGRAGAGRQVEEGASPRRRRGAKGERREQNHGLDRAWEGFSDLVYAGRIRRVIEDVVLPTETHWQVKRSFLERLPARRHGGLLRRDARERTAIRQSPRRTLSTSSTTGPTG